MVQDSLLSTNSMSAKMMDWIIWVIEKVAEEICDNDRNAAYNLLKKNGILDLYLEHYDITHSQFKEVLIDEIKEIIAMGGVKR